MNVIILVGLPGSGKSTISKKHFPNYTHINQDILGNRDACLKEMEKALELGNDVIIDRVNFSKQQRAYWIKLALDLGAHNITAIMLDVDPETCIARIHERKAHPTIKEDMPIEKKREIVYNFHKMMDIPSLMEGFNNILISKN